jgi:hypothetical protein
VRVGRKGRRADVTVDAADALGRFINGADGELKLIGGPASAPPPAWPLRQTAPGRYHLGLDLPGQGEYFLQLNLSVGGEPLVRQTRGLAVGYPDEMRLRPLEVELLRDAASASGGTYDPDPSAVFAPPDRPTARAVPLWPYLVAAAAFLLVADVALRRIDVGALRRTARAV